MAPGTGLFFCQTPPLFRVVYHILRISILKLRCHNLIVINKSPYYRFSEQRPNSYKYSVYITQLLVNAANMT